MKSDQINPDIQHSFEPLKRSLEAGFIPIPNALNFVRAMGTELQWIPKAQRQRTISRLKRKAVELEQLGMPVEMTLLIHALCDGWEDFDQGNV